MKFLANKTVVLIPSPATNGRNLLARVGPGSGIKSRHHIDIKKKQVLKIHAYIYIRINIVFHISLSYFKNIASDMHLTLHHFRPTANFSGIRLSEPLTTGVTVRQSQPVAIRFQAWPEALTALMRFKYVFLFQETPAFATRKLHPPKILPDNLLVEYLVTTNVKVCVYM